MAGSRASWRWRSGRSGDGARCASGFGRNRAGRRVVHAVALILDLGKAFRAVIGQLQGLQIRRVMRLEQGNADVAEEAEAEGQLGIEEPRLPRQVAHSDGTLFRHIPEAHHHHGAAGQYLARDQAGHQGAELVHADQGDGVLYGLDLALRAVERRVRAVEQAARHAGVAAQQLADLAVVRVVLAHLALQRHQQRRTRRNADALEGHAGAGFSSWI